MLKKSIVFFSVLELSFKNINLEFINIQKNNKCKAPESYLNLY